MMQLTEVLDHEIRTLDAVLLRLTAVRVLLASGAHDDVPEGLEELDAAVSVFEAAAHDTRRQLLAIGHTSFAELIDVLDQRQRADIEERLLVVTARQRDVRVALASAAAGAERALRNAADHLPADVSTPTPTGHRHPFFTEV